jgi:hypothetical protein
VSYANLRGLGEIYKVQVPLVGQVDMDIPTRQIANDFVTFGMQSLVAQSGSTVQQIGASLAAYAPAIVASAWPSLEQRLTALAEVQQQRATKTAILSVAALSVALVGSAILVRGKSKA